jgi:TPR repeat protein
MRLQLDIIHAAGRIFVKAVCTPSVSLITLASVRFCNSDRRSKTREENNEDLMTRVEANDASSICVLANFYQHGLNGFQQDHVNAIEQYTRAADLGLGRAHRHLGDLYHRGGDLKKAKFHFEAAAMAGHEGARCNLGTMEAQSGNMERAVKHWMIAASTGHYDAMHNLLTVFEDGFVSRESIETTLAAYNSSCAEIRIRSKARDSYIRDIVE